MAYPTLGYPTLGYAVYRDAREQARELLTHRENLRPYLAPQEASPRAKRLEQDER